MQRYLLSTLALSLLLTAAGAGDHLLLLLRDAKGTFYALVPNLWPVLVILGGMGWFGMPLDIATVMVASITLGLVVDDTIHTLAHYREVRAELGEHDAVADRIEKTAPAYLLTGVILASGFGVCALSDFAPTSRFGLLSAIAVMIAVRSADLPLVPVLFGRSDKWPFGGWIAATRSHARIESQLRPPRLRGRLAFARLPGRVGQPPARGAGAAIS